MKNILVLLHDDAGQEARLQAALDLTRALGGHLTGIDVCQAPAPVPGSIYGMVEADAMLLEDARAREQANISTVEQRLAREDVSWSMASMSGDLVDCIASQVGLADLIVLNRRLDDFMAPDMLGVTSKLVLKVSRPIVAVQEGLRSFDAAGTAIVAWDGSDAAAAALTASVPLLTLASSVVLVEVARSSSQSVEAAATYLSRHFIRPQVDLVASKGESHDEVAELIQAACRRRNAAYCVMGAYGHSKVRELLFGGVTRTMLKSSPVPLVIAH